MAKQKRHRVVKRDTHSRRLRKLLSRIKTRDLLVAVWAIRVAVLGQVDSAKRVMRLPEELAGEDPDSSHFIAPWILETLINEALSNDGYNSGDSFVDPRNYSNFANVYNVLTRLEDAESLMDIADGSVVRAMQRIGWRQFEWQQTVFIDRKIYRAWRLYMVPEASSYFEERYGITPDRVTAVGFMIFSKFLSAPALIVQDEITAWGVTREEIETVLSFISRPFSEMKFLAKKLRLKKGEVAYKPSVLRQAPIVSFVDKRGEGGRAYYCPLPDLCIQRITEGLYQDLVGNQNVMQKVAQEFESYASDILSHYSGDHLEVLREARYGPKGHSVLTPDLRCVGRSKEMKIIVECKRRLMPYKIASSADPTKHFPELYDDFVKGVQQIWRYASKIRRGIADDNWRLDKDTVGLVLTLFPWMLLSADAVTWIKSRATETLQEDWQVIESDMIPVSFSHIDDIEASLPNLPIENLRLALLRHASQDRIGYSFTYVAKDFYEDNSTIEHFDYRKKTEDYASWWRELWASVYGAD